MSDNRERGAFETAFPKPGCVDWDAGRNEYVTNRHGVDSITDHYNSRWETWQAARAQQPAKGDAVAMGDLSFDSDEHYKNAVLVQFVSREQCREAIRAGRCRFTVFGGEA